MRFNHRDGLVRILQTSGMSSVVAALLGLCCTVGSAFGDPTAALPAPVITPAGGTFDQPLTVTITPAVMSVLTGTPGWRTGLKYPGEGIEEVAALSYDGRSVAAMRARTNCRFIYKFPGVNLSPDRGGFPFYVWSLADISGGYAPALFAGVTELTSWDGNHYDYYFGETGNRVFMLLHQNWDNSGGHITLWSCAAGANQGSTAQQQLAAFAPLPIGAFAGQATRLELSGDKVRVRVGDVPLVSETTDADGWVVYTGTNAATGRVTAPLGATRFWFSLAGGDVPGRRELVLSDTPLTTTRFTYDGSPVTETSPVVSNSLTLTHDTTLRARIFSRAFDPSEETVAVFTSLIPQLPEESYVSPVYLSIAHATLDGSSAEVSVEGPSGTVDGQAIGDCRYMLRYPLSPAGAIPLVLHRNGVADLTTPVLWRPIDIGSDAGPHEIRIRCGESLLLTAGVGQTNALQMVVVDSTNQIYRTCAGTAGELFPVLFERAGVFTATAMLDGVSVGCLVVTVVQVDLRGPIACQVGFGREKDVVVYGPADGVFFTPNDPTLLEVSVKEPTAEGVRLKLKALKRGAPVLQARLGSAEGPVIAEQAVDEFTLETTAVSGMLMVIGKESGQATLRMRPYIPKLRLDFSMFAHYSTFYGGVRSFSVNTSEATSTAGEPGFRTERDEVTGEDVGVFDYTLEVPPTETRYCFSVAAMQSTSPWVKVGGLDGVNGGVCQVRSFNTLTFMKSDSDETLTEESAPSPAIPEEVWSERVNTFISVADQDSGVQYTVTIENGNARTDDYDTPVSGAQASARYINDKMTSNPKSCRKQPDPVTPDYKTGIQYGIYNKRLASGESGTSGILAVGRLDANGPTLDSTVDMFPEFVGMLPQRCGILYDGTRLVAEPVIVVKAGGEKANAKRAEGKGSDPSLYGVVGNGTSTWTFKAKDAGFDPEKHIRTWYKQPAGGGTRAALGKDPHAQTVTETFDVGRWNVVLEYKPKKGKTVLAKAELHSLVVENVHSDNVAAVPAAQSEPQGRPFEIRGDCASDVPMDASLFVEPSKGGARGRVSLDGYPQNEYWGDGGGADAGDDTDNYDLAQVFQLSHAQPKVVYLQGYSKPSAAADDKLALIADGQALIEQVAPEKCGDSEERFQGEPVAWRWEFADDEPFVVPRLDLVPDFNHDRTIDETNDRGKATPAHPFRFWINDDADETDISDDDHSVPGQQHPNCEDKLVNGRCDLLDFFPVWLDLKQALELMPPGNGVEYRLRQDDEAVKVVYTDLIRDKAGNFLIKEGNGYGPTLNEASHNAVVTTITKAGTVLSQAFLDAMTQDSNKGVLMLEGAKATSAPLILEVWKNGEKICR